MRAGALSFGSCRISVRRRAPGWACRPNVLVLDVLGCLAGASRWGHLPAPRAGGG
ncbi:hypothetical protein KCH_09630 [Kitasatospora cheerisanensis KCTC 2395]|uniref:Uncharacterized protein n=1 Tax=Kitasatospora cheerisanensis KCTC 2395 TaxID=1348663 RepID=A0A066Z1C1_9ACTN|nr:hypothetical protein KCH_09630 [Kitasatospora cheerisanensis KCTC 2395]